VGGRFGPVARSDGDGGLRVWRTIKRAIRAAVMPAFFLSLVAYCGWNTVHGDRGLIATRKHQAQLDAMHDELARAEAERQQWQHKVDGLRGPVDRDALDEQVRASLTLSNPADVIVPYPTGQKLY
jgi:cell division protein FtsB